VLPTKRGLRIADTREFVPPGDEIVGGQAQPGVAQVGLDRLRTARDLKAARCTG